MLRIWTFGQLWSIGAALCVLRAMSISSAQAGGTVVLANSAVAQYSRALDGIRATTPGVLIVNPSGADVPQRLASLDPDVIIAVGQKAVDVAQRAVPGKPIVYCMSLAGRNRQSRTLTGVPLQVSPSEQLAKLKQVLTPVRRIGVIYTPSVSGDLVQKAKQISEALSLTIDAVPITGAREVRGVLPRICQRIDALWIVPDPKLITVEMFRYILVFTLERKLPLFGFLDNFTKAGALASVAPDYYDNGRRAAELAAEIAARPATSRLPVPPPRHTAGILSINLKTAGFLGIDIPPDVVSQARNVHR